MGVHGGPDIVTDGLVFAMDPFNEQSWTGPNSSTTYNTVGTNTSTIYGSTSGSYGDNSSFDFDGVDEYIDCGTSIPPRFSTTGDGNTEPWTVSLWVKFDLSSNEYPIEFPYGEAGRAWQILTISSKLCFGNRYGTALCTESGTTALNSNQWNNIIVSFDGADKTDISSWKLYINGVNISITTRSHWGLNSGTNILIGRSFTTLYYEGNIGPVSLYTRALSANEVLQNYNALKGRFGL